MNKRYHNSTTKERYYEGQSLTRRVENGVFTGIPSEEQLYEWGFREWVEPAPTPEQLLERAKASKIAELEAYDDSDAVNSFEIVMGNETTSAWIEPDKRSNYRGSLEDCELLGVTDIEVPIAGMLISMTVADARVKLAQVQLYADSCTIVTEGHKYAINALETVEDVEAYDFTTGYPEKLTFDVTATA